MISPEEQQSKEKYIQQLLPNFSCKDKQLMVQAFVHKSFAMDYTTQVLHNERLEYLGDAIIESIIAHRLFVDFPQYAESELTLYRIALVREETLAMVARDIKLDEQIFISKGEERSEGRAKDSLLSDCLEALIGFLFIQEGYEYTQKFVTQYLYKYITQVDKLLPVKSYKAQVQEYSQKKHKKLPQYTETPHELEDNGNIISFKSELSIDEQVVSTGFAASKKKAQEDAAKNFWENLPPSSHK